MHFEGCRPCIGTQPGWGTIEGASRSSRYSGSGSKDLTGIRDGENTENTDNNIAALHHWRPRWWPPVLRVRCRCVLWPERWSSEPAACESFPHSEELQHLHTETHNTKWHTGHSNDIFTECTNHVVYHSLFLKLTLMFRRRLTRGRGANHIVLQLPVQGESTDTITESCQTIAPSTFYINASPCFGVKWWPSLPFAPTGQDQMDPELQVRGIDPTTIFLCLTLLYYIPIGSLITFKSVFWCE